MRILTLLTAILSMMNSQSREFKCVHDKMKKRLGDVTANYYSNSPFEKLRSEFRAETATNERLLADSDWRPIKFLVDYSNIPTSNSANSDAIEYFKLTVFKQVVKIFGGMLKVRGPTTIPKLTKTGCDSELVIPNQYKESDINADFLIFVKIADEEDNYLAWAGSCLYSPYDRRPIMGILQINSRYVEIEPAEVNQSIMVIAHEFTHALGFSDDMFKRYPIGAAKTVESVQINGETRTRIIMPGVVALAKKHFNCPTYSGVLLENEGGSGSAGSHWEKNSLGNEYMVAVASGRMIFSGFTLNFLNDIGWYQVDLSQSERMYWGAGRGCDWGQTCSNKFSEYCSTEQESGCTSDFLEKTLCTRNSFTDGCLINNYQFSFDCQNTINFNYWVNENKYETPGRFSRCFLYTMGKNNLAGCFPASCESGQVVFSISGTSYTCKLDGEQIKAGSITVTCPVLQTFCSAFEMRGNNDCSANGIERNDKTCRCGYFYRGDDCSIKQSCTNGESSQFCDKIRPFDASEVGTTEPSTPTPTPNPTPSTPSPSPSTPSDPTTPTNNDTLAPKANSTETNFTTSQPNTTNNGTTPGGFNFTDFFFSLSVSINQMLVTASFIWLFVA